MFGVRMAGPVFFLKPRFERGAEDRFERLLKTTPHIERLLSTDRDPPIRDLVQYGVVSTFFDFLDREKLLFKFEATWAPSKVDLGMTELHKPIIGRCAMLKLVKLYKNSRDESQQLAVLAFANMVGDSFECGELEATADYEEFFMVLDMLIVADDLLILRTVSRTLQMFCVDLAPNFAQKERLYSVLQKLINFNDLEVLISALSALGSSLSDSADDVQDVIGSGIFPRLAELLTHPSDSVLFPVLSTLGKIVSEVDEQTQNVIDQKVLQNLRGLLINNYSESVKKLACNCIASITSHGSELVQAVVCADLVTPLSDLLKGEIDCKEDAVLAILNCVTEAPPPQIKDQLHEGIIKVLCDLLDSRNENVLKYCLQALAEILEIAEANENLLNIYKKAIVEVGGLTKIQELKFLADNVIFQGAVELLRKYWIEEEYLSALADDELKAI